MSTATAGFDVGGSFIKAVRREPDGITTERVMVRTPTTSGALLENLAEMASRLGPVSALGVGLAGMVDHERGVFVWGPHLPGEELAVGERLSEAVGVPVMVDNDANLAALGEFTEGAAGGYENVAMVTLGTGIGVGLILDGVVYRGTGFAGEAGHITIDPHGSPCSCGRNGCWETVVSGSVFESEARKLLGESASSADLVEAARAGNQQAIDRFSIAGEWLGRGLESILLLVDPHVIVVGGAGSAAGDHLLDPARKRLATTEGARYRDSTPVIPGMLGPDAGAVGAAIAAQWMV